MYPAAYRLDAMTSHLVELLDRRREGEAAWTPEVEARLRNDAREALMEAGKRFATIADDPQYWHKLTQTFLDVALPRYLLIAQRFHDDRLRNFGIWRGGDFISRAVYADRKSVV